MPTSDLQRILDKLDRLEESVGEIRSAVAVLQSIEDREWPAVRAKLSRVGERVELLERRADHTKGWVAGASIGGGTLGYVASKIAEWLQ